MSDLPRITDAPRGSRVSWVYGGVWGLLAGYFYVPQEPPELPSVDGEATRSFRPAPNFLTYLLVQAGIGYAVISLAVLAIGIGASIAESSIGLPLLAVALWGRR